MRNQTNNRTIFCVLGSLIALGLLTCGPGCASGNGDASAASTSGSQVRVYEVFGMDCPGCHGGVEKLIMKIPTVLAAKANWKEKRVAVTVKPGAELNDEDIYDAIKLANFTAGKRIK